MNQPPNFPQGQPPYQPGQTPPPGYPPYAQYPPNSQPGYPPYPQQPMQPPQQQQPVKKKRTGLKIGCGAVTAIIVLAIIIGVANGGKGSTTPATPSSSGSSNTTQQPPSAPQTWTTTHTYTGSGQKKTETITVPADWKIQWQCDPTSFDGINYNVIIGVDNSDGTMADPAAINDMCKSGNTSGETEERTAGNVYLDVNSEGSWTITIQELK